jgi:hypothetical protein
MVSTGTCVIGVVARNDQGEFLMGMNRSLPDVSGPLAAEAEALRVGVQLIHTITNGPVIMEIDSLELLGLWRNRASQRSPFTSIFSDIQDLASSFSSFCVMHVPHMVNMAAYRCAHYANASAAQF